MKPEERAQWASEYTRINRKLEKNWFPKVKKALDSKVSSLIAVLKESGHQAAIRYLETDLANPDLTTVVNDLYKNVGLVHARRSEKILRKEARDSRSKSFGRDMEVKRLGKIDLKWVSFIEKYLRTYLIEKITFNVAATTRDALLKIMFLATEMGWGVDETVRAIGESNFTRVQAARIVRTETNRAANVGVVAQGTTFEYELQKVWISVQDNRTRGVNPEDHADHFHLDGQVVDFDSVFTDSRNNHELRHPGDPKAAAEDVINCRCSFATQAKRDENGRMIPKTNPLPSQIAPAA